METTKPSKKKYFDGFVVSAIMGKDGNLKVRQKEL